MGFVGAAHLALFGKKKTNNANLRNISWIEFSGLNVRNALNKFYAKTSPIQKAPINMTHSCDESHLRCHRLKPEPSCNVVNVDLNGKIPKFNVFTHTKDKHKVCT